MKKIVQLIQVLVFLLALLYTSGYLLWRGLLESSVYETSWHLQISEVFWAWFYLPLFPLTLIGLLMRQWRTILVLALPLSFFMWEYGAQFLPNWQHEWNSQALYAQEDEANDEFEEKQLRVMTWNSFRSSRIADDLEELLLDNGPDIITIQEVSSGLRRNLQDFEQIYPYQYYESYATLMTISRMPLSQPQIDRQFRVGCRCQPLSLEWDGRRLTIINIHIPRPKVYFHFRNGLPKITYFNPKDQDLHYKVLFKILEQVEGPLLVQGDINTTERQPNFLRLTQTLTDSFAEAGWGMGFTYPNSTFRDPWWLMPVVQIDHILHSEEMVAISATVDDLQSSDHLFVAATLRWR